jgi:hypothetical protein
MLGTELCVRKRRAATVCSSPNSFESGDSLLAVTPAGYSRPEPTPRGDLSLARNEIPFPAPHDEVKAPGLPLRRHTWLLHWTVRSEAPPPEPVCTRSKAFSTPPTRIPACGPALPALAGSPLPFGAFTPPDQSVQPGSSRNAHLSDLPDCPSLPAAALV